MTNSETARQQMVEQQVRTWDVFDEEVLETMSSVPRDRYVPLAFADCAHADSEIPLANGQCMLRPSIAGRILQAVDLRPSDRVLEIGTGTGYLTHCIAELAASVSSIDLFDDFVAAASDRLDEFGVDNTELQVMDAGRDLPAGDFDVLIVTASMHDVDPRMVEKLAPGGRMFVVTGESPVMTATLIRRDKDGTTQEDLFETDIPPMVAEPERAEFSF